jgi:hypothetical protein
MSSSGFSRRTLTRLARRDDDCSVAGYSVSPKRNGAIAVCTLLIMGELFQYLQIWARSDTVKGCSQSANPSIAERRDPGLRFYTARVNCVRYLR